MRIHGTVRMLILIAISIMAMVITDGIHMYCVADDHPAWGYVYARSDEEFILKTGLPTSAMDSCKLYHAELFPLTSYLKPKSTAQLKMDFLTPVSASPFAIIRSKTRSSKRGTVDIISTLSSWILSIILAIFSA